MSNIAVLAYFSGLVLGWIACRMLTRENDCPRIEYGYNCKGENCDHRLSELYEAKWRLALHREMQQSEKDS